MTDFARARTMMVDCQLRTVDVTSPRVLAAFMDVPRERFLPADKQAIAYVDMDVPLGGGRYLVEAGPLAKLLQIAAVTEQDHVLDVGCGPGYSTAVLERIAGTVVGLEVDATLARQAETTLAALGHDRAVIEQGELKAGAPKRGPFDLILLAGAVDEVPASLHAQLRDGGRLVAVVGRGRTAKAVVDVKVGDTIGRRIEFDVALPPLPGFARAETFEFAF